MSANHRQGSSCELSLVVTSVIIPSPTLCCRPSGYVPRRTERSALTSSWKPPTPWAPTWARRRRTPPAFNVISSSSFFSALRAGDQHQSRYIRSHSGTGPGPTVCRLITRFGQVDSLLPLGIVDADEGIEDDTDVTEEVLGGHVAIVDRKPSQGEGSVKGTRTIAASTDLAATRPPLVLHFPKCPIHLIHLLPLVPGLSPLIQRAQHAS